MLVTIDGLPGGNKSALCAGVAEALGIPVLLPTAEDIAVYAAASSGDASHIALTNIIFHATPGPTLGVRKGSVAQTDAYFGLLFEPTSPIAAAAAQRLVKSQLGWTENVRVLVDVSPEQSLALAPGSGLTMAQLVELKTAEAMPPPEGCTLVVVNGPATEETLKEAVQQLRPPPPDVANLI